MKNTLSLVIIIIVFVILACTSPPPTEKNDNANNSSQTQNINSNKETIVKTSPTTNPNETVIDLENPEIQSRIAEGEKIFKRFDSDIAFGLGFGKQGEYIALSIPIEEWNKMTKDDQINLTFYAQNLVIEIRKNPVSFVDNWNKSSEAVGDYAKGKVYDGLYKDEYVEKVKELCNTCWSIWVVKVVKRDGVYAQSYPIVSGTTVQSFRDNPKKEFAISYEEKKAKDEKDEKEKDEKMFASIPSNEHLAQAILALNTNYDPSQEKFGNTFLARKHIKAIGKNAPEYNDAQKLLQKVIQREKEKAEYRDAVIREVKRLAN